MPLITHPEIEIDYPDYDGNPMSDNTEQYRFIVMIKENLEILYASLLNVFVAGDLLWYPIEGDNKTRLAPDVMVAFGRPKGRRGSYQQWKEGNIAPQIAFEILSPRNYAPEMEEKRKFYESHGVEEYYSYDPDRFRLKGWLRQNNHLLPIPEMNGWVSPRMGIRFSHVQGELELYRPDGRKFLTSVELDQEARQAQLAAIQQMQRAEQQAQRAQAAQQEAQAAQQQVQLIIVNLLRSGMSMEQIAEISGVSVAHVEALQANLS
jgi:Uma2 family endonuclease/DNA-binding CsgD family transcriptional regulator